METLQGASDFLKGVATAANVLVSAVEKLEKDMGDAQAVARAKGEFWRLPGAKGSPETLPGATAPKGVGITVSKESLDAMASRLVNASGGAMPGTGVKKVTTDVSMVEWICANAKPGCQWEKVVLDYISYRERTATPDLGPELGDKVPQGLRLFPRSRDVVDAMKKESKPATDAEMMQWMRKNARPGSSWDQAAADYICYKEGSALRPESKGPSVSYKLKPDHDKLTDLGAAEQDDLAKDAAEYDAIPPQIEGRPAVDTNAMAMEISRKEVVKSEKEMMFDAAMAKYQTERAGAKPATRNEIISAYKAANAEPTAPKPERLPIEVFNDILSTGATIGGPTEQPQTTPSIIKVVFAGESGSGKSRALSKLVGKDSDEHAPTIGVNYDFYVNAKGHKLQIWDTAGQERFRTITAAYYKGVDHCILFSGHYLTQNDLDLFQPETCFKRFTTQEALKAYLDSL
jgi:hypothetical protein